LSILQIHLFFNTCWFRCGHGDRGSAVLINWAIPAPITLIVTKLFSFYHFVIYELQWRVLVMDPRYIFAVQCHNTHTWWPRPLTSSFRRVDSLQILFEFYWAFLSLSLSLIWEGTCIGFFDDFLFLQCQVPRTTPCMFSILSPLI
jgi:hypothetical protein